MTIALIAVNLATGLATAETPRKEVLAVLHTLDLLRSRAAITVIEWGTGLAIAQAPRKDH